MSDGRIPPHDLEAEAAVLGAILIEGTGHIIDRVATSLSPDKFYSEAHRRIGEAVFDLHRQGKPTDSISVISHLKAKDRLGQVGGPSYVTDILNAVPSLTNVEHYADIVWRTARRRDVIAAAQGIVAEGYIGEPDAEADDKFCDRAAQVIFDVTQTKAAAKDFEVLQASASRVVRHAMERASGAAALPGVSTGFVGLDKYLDGLQAPRLYVLAARPGVGKTALAVNIALHVGQTREGNAKTHVAFFSLEMNCDELATRALGVVANVRASNVLSIRPSESARILSALTERFPGKTVHVNDDPNQTVLGIKAASRKLKAKVQKEGDRLGLIVVDYLQLMDSPNKRKGENREQEVSAISRGLKKLAGELGVPVLALSQLNRGVESRGGENARPRLSDLRESGAIEQDANVVILLHKMAKPKPLGPFKATPEDDDEKQSIEAIIAKNRGGPTGVVRLAYEAKYTKFVDVTDDDDESWSPPKIESSEEEKPSWWE